MSLHWFYLHLAVPVLDQPRQYLLQPLHPTDGFVLPLSVHSFGICAFKQRQFMLVFLIENRKMLNLHPIVGLIVLETDAAAPTAW
ncbi:hypothetical protein [Acinetobacter baumannii]|uniref:hypothetical protein n=1 Tax=Acinetobacter baumannii TaxID=470 RepID=UPI0022352CDC|nr:hypothetical protein [Acinetobacter baumannii]